MRDADKWDRRGLELARHVAEWSKDPSTKIGAVIMDPNHRILSLGYNGFPVGVPDLNLDDRDYKYERTIHAEMNALLFCSNQLWGATMYVWPMPPCSRCAGPIIQSGIVRIVSPPAEERWADSCKIGNQMFMDADIHVTEMEI
jgi:dCMP deaminase